MLVGALVQNFGGFPETARSTRACVDLAQHAERAGYASVWVTDHIVLPAERTAQYPHNDSGHFPYTAAQDIHEPLVLLGALASATSRVTLGTAVLVLPYRHPLTLAKMLATVDQLAEGRLVVGTGVGWLRDEFAALGLDHLYPVRGRVTDEYLQVMRTAWTSDAPFSFAGTHVAFGEIGALPRPARRPHPPLWVGGKGPRALARVTAHGDGYFAIASTPDELAVEVRALRELAATAGRDARRLTIALIDGVVVTERPLGDDRAPLHGTVEQIHDGLERYAAAGLDHLVAGVRLAGDPTFAGACAALDAVAPLLPHLAPTEATA
jgi:probable F420-dependent oxidoreductase